jgi:hypothetical protein
VVGAVPFLTAGVLRLRVVARRRRANAALHRLARAASRHTVAVRTPASEVERTATALIRSRRWAWAVVAVGLVGVVAAIALGAVMDAADRELRAAGITTVGTVVEVHPDRKWSTGAADVTFTAAGHSATRYVVLGVSADDYVEGQQVDVLYDPDSPDTFTINDESYEPPWVTWPTMLAVVTALLAVPAGAWMIRIRRTTSRILAHDSWEPVRVRVRVEDKRCWFTTDDGTVWRGSVDGRWRAPDATRDQLGDRASTQLELAAGSAVGRDLASSDGGGVGGFFIDHDVADAVVPQDAWWVRLGDVAVFSPDQGSPLVLARLR